VTHLTFSVAYKILNDILAVPMNHLDLVPCADLSGDVLPNRDSRYLAVPQLSFNSLLLQELLLIHPERTDNQQSAQILLCNSV